MSGAHLLYVYAVVQDRAQGRAQGGAADAVGTAGPLPAGLRGIGGGTVRLVRDAGLAAVVGPVPAADFEEEPLRANLEDLPWLERTARGHQEVVDAAMAAGCALPMRLATVCRDEQGVRRMLAADRELFAGTFERLEGREEYGVKVYADPAAPTGSVGSEDAPASRPAPETTGGTGGARLSGREYLRRRRQQRQAGAEAVRRAEARAGEVHEALAERAEHTRLHRPQDARLSGEQGVNLLNGAYLVSREDAGAFVELVGTLAEQAPDGMRIHLTGPWAPYSFTQTAADGVSEGQR